MKHLYKAILYFIIPACFSLTLQAIYFPESSMKLSLCVTVIAAMMVASMLFLKHKFKNKKEKQ